jgi:ribosome-associated protein
MIHSHELARQLAEAALNKKAQDVALLDVAEVVGYTDVFVVCTATNPRQVRAIADEMRRVAKELGMTILGIEGGQRGRWVLGDFDDVVVHVFTEEGRAFYDLEGLWTDAPRLEAPEGEPSVTEEPLFSLP